MKPITIGGILYNLVPVEDQREKSDKINEVFFQLFFQTNRIVVDKEKFQNSTFGFLGDKYLWEYNSSDKILWVSYKYIWSVLTPKFDYDTYEIEQILTSLIENHFNCSNIKTYPSFEEYQNEIEKHFN
ncbi:hypothetical protein ACFS6H_20035 [Terrimonas rubra]|uniref:Uncharacterized protein n=1 Tax=Terrimonas rubra TaxID=1035890 RepID=A0ABW6ABJ4_9BACT